VSIVLLSAGWCSSAIYCAPLRPASGSTPGIPSWLPSARCRTSSTTAKTDNLIGAALERLRALPGVESVSLAWAAPLNPFLAFSRVGGEVRPDTSSHAIRTQYNFNAVGPD